MMFSEQNDLQRLMITCQQGLHATMTQGKGSCQPSGSWKAAGYGKELRKSAPGWGQEVGCLHVAIAEELLAQT